MLFKNFKTKLKFNRIKYKYFHVEKTLQEIFKPIIEDLDVYIANDGEMWFLLEDMINYVGLDFYTIFEYITPGMECQDSNGKIYISEFGIYRTLTLMNLPKKEEDPFVGLVESFEFPETLIKDHNKHDKCHCNKCKKKSNEKNNPKPDLSKVPVDIKDLVNLSKMLGNMINLQKEMLETIEKMQKIMEKIKIKK